MDKKIEELENLRCEIRKITLEIVKLVHKRNELARKIGIIKISKGLPIKDEAIEEKLKSYIEEICDKEEIPINLCLEVLDFLIIKAIEIQMELLKKID